MNLASTRPLVSVAIPFWNQKRFLEEAIESVLAQSYPGRKLLLVDDGSTDCSREIAFRYRERSPERISYLAHQVHYNRGISATRNLAICAAHGNYIAFFDSDDVWLPKVAMMGANPRASVVYGRTQYWHGWTGNSDDGERDWIPDPGVSLGSLHEAGTLLAMLFPLHGNQAEVQSLPQQPDSIHVEIARCVSSARADIQIIYPQANCRTAGVTNWNLKRSGMEREVYARCGAGARAMVMRLYSPVLLSPHWNRFKLRMKDKVVFTSISEVRRHGSNSPR